MLFVIQAQASNLQSQNSQQAVIHKQNMPQAHEWNMRWLSLTHQQLWCDNDLSGTFRAS